jgi:hypothetical protein
MFSALSEATGQIDSKFLIAFWLPALVSVFAGVGVSALLAGPALVDFWANNLDSVEQILLGAVLLGLTTVLALFLKAAGRPIILLFSGGILPPPVAEWAARRQRTVKEQAEHRVLAGDAQDPHFVIQHKRRVFEQGFPQHAAHVKPTRFGNMMACWEDHATFVHGMDHWLWWPRLLPLLPEAMSERAASEVASTVGLLNLSLVWAVTALGGAALLGVAGGFWTTAHTVLLVGLLLSYLCYRAAVYQGTEAGRHVHAAFDLYRHEILKQMDLDVPDDREAETALWLALSHHLLDRAPKVPSAEATLAAAATIAKTGSTPRRKTASTRRRPPASRTSSTTR